MQVTQEQLTTLLKNQFGFEHFRPGQCEAIQTLLEQKRLLCIQPTGHGKSLLYQLPSVLLDGVTIVISPLLALMRDQLQQLQNRFHIKAASINSDQTEDENNHARLLAQKGELKILFVAPEQLDNLSKFEFLLALPVSLIVVDEAHCISTWGHDFRPSYRQIIQLVRALENKNSDIRILGLTATANEKTELDIKQQLSFEGHDIQVHRESMDRPNIQLTVIPTKGIAAKLFMLEKLIQQLKGDGLIYCATRENTELVAEYLQFKNINAMSYHAGLDSDSKKQLQAAFTQGQYKVMAATNALGMGIDKSDLRFIIHFDVPGSITAYYQEVGRAGRDGLLANGFLLFDKADKKIQEHFIHSAQPTAKDFQTILDGIKSAPELLKLIEIKRLSGMHPTLVTVIIAELVEQGYLEKKRQGNGQVYAVTNKIEAPNLQRYENQYQVRTQELNAMLTYGQQQEKCRMAILRQALGDAEVQNCGHCNVCNKELFTLNTDLTSINQVDSWLMQRPVRTAKTVRNKISAGIALFDGKLHSPLFIKFMKERMENESMGNDLYQILKQELTQLVQEHQISSVISIPSRTWKARSHFSEFIAEELNVPGFIEYLYWQEEPVARQGELLNNDQRRYNVENKMTVDLQQKIPAGNILLLDDYTGSGATIKEAARVLRQKANVKQAIIPFTIATVKWRLGSQGMV